MRRLPRGFLASSAAVVSVKVLPEIKANYNSLT